MIQFSYGPRPNFLIYCPPLCLLINCVLRPLAPGATPEYAVVTYCEWQMSHRRRRTPHMDRGAEHFTTRTGKKRQSHTVLHSFLLLKMGIFALRWAFLPVSGLAVTLRSLYADWIFILTQNSGGLTFERIKLAAGQVFRFHSLRMEQLEERRLRQAHTTT